MTASLLGIFAISWPPAEWLFAYPLERPYRRMLDLSEQADAIVVLAGGGDPFRTELPLSIPGPGTYARCRYAAWLYHHWRPVPVIVSGGISKTGQPPVAELMSSVLRAEGVPGHMVTEESRSTNTRENSSHTAELLRRMGARRIALVVDADSMLRAELCFRKQNVEVVPAPLAHRSMMAPASLIPSASTIRGNEVTLHEALGLVWYKLRGWI